MKNKIDLITMRLIEVNHLIDDDLLQIEYFRLLKHVFDKQIIALSEITLDHRYIDPKTIKKAQENNRG